MLNRKNATKIAVVKKGGNYFASCWRLIQLKAKALTERFHQIGYA